MVKKKQKRGRPHKGVSALTEIVRCRVSKNEMERIEKAAKGAGLPCFAWVRAKLLEAAALCALCALCAGCTERAKAVSGCAVPNGWQIVDTIEGVGNCGTMRKVMLWSGGRPGEAECLPSGFARLVSYSPCRVEMQRDCKYTAAWGYPFSSESWQAVLDWDGVYTWRGRSTLLLWQPGPNETQVGTGPIKCGSIYDTAMHAY